MVYNKNTKALKRSRAQVNAEAEAAVEIEEGKSEQGVAESKGSESVGSEKTGGKRGRAGSTGRGGGRRGGRARGRGGLQESPEKLELIAVQVLKDVGDPEEQVTRNKYWLDDCYGDVAEALSGVAPQLVKLSCKRKVYSLSLEFAWTGKLTWADMPSKAPYSKWSILRIAFRIFCGPCMQTKQQKVHVWRKHVSLPWKKCSRRRQPMERMLIRSWKS